MVAETLNNKRRYLSPDFSPGDFDVICGRGKECYNHTGNLRFRTAINMALAPYNEADTKLQKSLIVMSIVETFRSNSDEGGFVRLDRSRGTWYEIGDEAAREKVGQTIREALVQQDPEKRAKKRIKRAISKARKTATHIPTQLPKSFRMEETRSSEITLEDEMLAATPPQLLLESSRDWFTPPSSDSDSDAYSDLSSEIEDDFDQLFDVTPAAA